MSTDEQIAAAHRDAQQLYINLVTTHPRQVLLWLRSDLNKIADALLSDERYAEVVEYAKERSGKPKGKVK